MAALECAAACSFNLNGYCGRKHIRIDINGWCAYQSHKQTPQETEPYNLIEPDQRTETE